MDTHVPEPADRVIDFDRRRWLQCPGCLHSWEVGWDFIEEWDECQTGCPSCGILADDNLVDHSPYVHAPDEAMADDALVQESSWGHTSFHSDWPQANYDPWNDYSPTHRQNMEREIGSDTEERVRKARDNAFHVGTYEAAVANLYRRLDNETGYLDLNFRIFRVQLVDDVKVSPSIFPELSGFFGHTPLATACPPPSQVVRYANIREDEGSVSLALRRSAVMRTQSVKILGRPVDPAEVETITHEIEKEDALSPRPPRKNLLGRFMNPQPNRVAEGHKVAARLRAEIPWRIREHFHRGAITKLNETIDPETWARWVLGVRELAINPTGVLEAIKAQPWVTVEHSESDSRWVFELSGN